METGNTHQTNDGWCKKVETSGPEGDFSVGQPPSVAFEALWKMCLTPPCFFFFKFVYLREKERDRERESQAVSTLSEQSLMEGSNS